MPLRMLYLYSTSAMPQYPNAFSSATVGSTIAAISVASTIEPVPIKGGTCRILRPVKWPFSSRSEEHTSELQSHHDLVCRLLLEKKKKKKKYTKYIQKPNEQYN